MKDTRLFKLIGIICVVLIIGVGGLFTYQAFTSNSKSATKTEQNEQQSTDKNNQDENHSTKKDQDKSHKSEKDKPSSSQVEIKLTEKKESDKERSADHIQSSSTNKIAATKSVEENEVYEKNQTTSVSTQNVTNNQHIKRAPVQAPVKSYPVKPKYDTEKHNQKPVQNKDTDVQISSDAITKLTRIQDALFTIINSSSIEYDAKNCDSIEWCQKIGTGFLYHKDGYIMTNAHVVEGANEVDIMTHNTIKEQNNNVKSRYYKGHVIGFSTNPDIALIFVPELKNKYYPIDFTYKAKKSNKVISYSSGHDEFDSTQGEITNISKDEVIVPYGYPELYQMSADAPPGFSGGPVVLKSNKKIIAVNAATNIITNEGYSIPIHTVKEHADRWIKEHATKKQAQLDKEIKEKFPPKAAYQEEFYANSDETKKASPQSELKKNEEIAKGKAVLTNPVQNKVNTKDTTKNDQPSKVETDNETQEAISTNVESEDNTSTEEEIQIDSEEPTHDINTDSINEEDLATDENDEEAIPAQKPELEAEQRNLKASSNQNEKQLNVIEKEPIKDTDTPSDLTQIDKSDF